jgi:type VII secretion integral membrane protein EccD
VKGAILSPSDPGLRAVSVHAGTAVVDVVLPAAVPVATLIPSIIDILDDCGADRSDDQPTAAYRLSPLGKTALDASTTLAQHDIRDGAVLILSQSRPALPAPRYDDVAEAVAETLNADPQPWTRRGARLTVAVAAGFFTCVGGLTLIRNNLSDNTARSAYTTTGIAAMAALIALLLAHRAARDPFAGLTLSLVATAFAALAGSMAVPGASGAPNALLAAMAAAVTSVLAIRITGRGGVALTAVACFALITAGAAFASVITGAPLHTIGPISALVSLGLLGTAGRLSIALARLSPHLSDDDGLVTKARRADAWLASLLAAFSSAAAIAAVATAAAGRAVGAPRSGCIAFAAVTGALLLLRARSAHPKTTLVFVASGTSTIGATFAIGAAGAPGRGPWIAAVTAMLVAAAVYVDFVAPAMAPSPVLRRCVELSEYLALLAMAPLTCWICGFYGAVRTLNLA